MNIKKGKKKLIVTAHDFGLCRSVNRGILHALNHKNNIFTELSLLPNAPGSSEAAKIARKKNISVDLCLELSNFRPLAKDVKSLTDKKGDFLKFDTINWDFSSADKFKDEDIIKEIEAQYEWFLRNVGRKPSALTTRKLIHGDPKILMPVVEKAKREKLPIRVPYWMWKMNYGAQSYVEGENIRTTDSIFMCLKDWKGKFGYDLRQDIDRLITDIKAKNGVAELIIFAGFVDAELFKISSLNWERGQFLQILEDKEVISKIKNNFELISYKNI